MNILITGGTGLIGQRLAKLLIQHQMSPRLLSRTANPNADIPQFEWNIKKDWIDPLAFEHVDVLIHLAGANVSEGRWTKSRKQEIMDSRINSTRLLFKTVEQLENRPKLLICSSATGYYGNLRFEHVSSEEDDPGNDFLATVCQNWETEADHFENLGLRIVKVRTGVVLDEKGGALLKMIQPIRVYAGAPLASGSQYINWIHWEDWCLAVIHLINEKQLKGPFNLVAPNPETNEVLTRLIAKIVRRPLWLPNVPAFVLKLILGEMASIVINGHKVSSKKLEDSGYQFTHDTLETALIKLLGDD